MKRKDFLKALGVSLFAPKILQGKEKKSPYNSEEKKPMSVDMRAESDSLSSYRIGPATAFLG